MNLLSQFFLYNLLPSVAVGLMSWLVIVLSLKVLSISDARLRLTFLGLPVVKSALLLLGIGLILPWPPSFFIEIQSKALSIEQLFPWLLMWVGVLLFAYVIFVKFVRRSLLHHAYTDSGLLPRIEQSLSRVLKAYHQRPLPECDIGFCSFSIKAPKPKLLLSDRLSSPTALTEGGKPIIILPKNLVDVFTDKELDGVIAHELGHFVIRRSRWCSTTFLRRLVIISPASALVSAQLNREEEMACDDIAVNVVGQSDVYAETLIKSYRFAQKQPSKIRQFVQPLPRLLGNQPQLSARIERLLETQSAPLNSKYQYVVACVLWFGLIFLFFNG